MKVKDLVPVTTNKVQLFYKEKDSVPPVYRNIGEARYLEDMPEELLELKVFMIAPVMDNSMTLEVRVDYKGENNCAGGRDIRRLEAENEVMRKALQEIVAYDVRKYMDITGKLAKSPYATAYGVVREYAKFALDTISGQEPQ